MVLASFLIAICSLMRDDCVIAQFKKIQKTSKRVLARDVGIRPRRYVTFLESSDPTSLETQNRPFA